MPPVPSTTNTSVKYNAKEGGKKVSGVDTGINTAASLETSSAARLDLLLAYREFAQEPQARFARLKAAIWAKMDDNLTESNNFFTGLARPSDGTSGERVESVEAVKEWAKGEKEWAMRRSEGTYRMEIIILRNMLEVTECDENDLARILQRYDINASASAIHKRIIRLLEQPGLPALAMLKRSCPRWWSAMLLGDDNTAALDILAKKGFDMQATTEATPDILLHHYSGTIAELVDMDNDQSSWLPNGALDADAYIKFVQLDVYADRELTVNEIVNIDQTRIAVAGRQCEAVIDEALDMSE